MDFQLFASIMDTQPTGYYFDRLEQAQAFYKEARTEVDAPKAEILNHVAEMFDVDKEDI